MKKLIPILVLALLSAVACKKETEIPVSRMLYRIHSPSGGTVSFYQNYTGTTQKAAFDDYIQFSDNVKPGDSIKLRVDSPGIITVEILKDRKSLHFIEHPSRVSLQRRIN